MFDLLTRVSLSSWDEAWYGVIAKNVLASGDIFNLKYNNFPFFDHPPLVIWLQVICFKIFGVNEFSVRLPSFLFSFIASFFIFLIAKKLFGKVAGIFSAISVFSSPWFLSRSLSGNLDIVLTALFLSTFYFILVSRENKKYLYHLSVSLSLLFLTKSLVPLTILPLILVMFWGKKFKIKDFVFPAVLFLLITLPWFVINIVNNKTFIARYLAIGYPGEKNLRMLFDNILLTKTYIHLGIGNIFIWGFVSLILGFILFPKKYFPIVVFLLTFLFPFAFSNKGHIWHLIPVHPFWFMSFFGFVELSLKKFKPIFIFLPILIMFLIIVYPQLKRNWYEIVDIPKYTSDIKILSIKASSFNEPLFVDDDSIPEAIFYSSKPRVEKINQRGEIAKMFEKKDQKFIIITRDWRLNEEDINKKDYELISKDRDKVLILKKAVSK